MMKYIGIDHGKKGAIAILNDDGSPCELHDMPYMGNELDIDAAWEIINSHTPARIMLEEVTSIHKRMKGYDIFVFGKGYGSWISFLKQSGTPFELLHAQKWKKEYRLTGKDKEYAIEQARQLFPSLIKKLGSTKDGRADALLIAEWGRRHRR